VPSTEHVVIELGGTVIAETRASYRVLETSHPPGYYLPRAAFRADTLRPAEGSSYCEWKGQAAYFDVVGGDRLAARAAWHYPDPTPAFRALRDHVALYPAAMDRVTVDGEVVQPQEGGFYGGWITARVVGPFKGAPRTSGW
jgi:uncharacterized protein (DUF427 family)